MEYKPEFTTTGLAEAMVTLRDGVTRKFYLSYSALYALEQIAGMPFTAVFAAGLGIRELTWLIYAGCLKDATDRREKLWSVEKVQRLLEPADFRIALPVVGRAVREAFFGTGEPEAGAAADAPADPESSSPGAGPTPSSPGSEPA